MRLPPAGLCARGGVQDAVNRLNGLQTNAEVLAALRRSGMAMNARSLPEMREFVKRMGYQVHAVAGDGGPWEARRG